MTASHEQTDRSERIELLIEASQGTAGSSGNPPSRLMLRSGVLGARTCCTRISSRARATSVALCVHLRRGRTRPCQSGTL